MQHGNANLEASEPTAKPATRIHSAGAKEMLPACKSIPMPWEGLSKYLLAKGMRMNLERLPQQFAGGLANLNYLIELDGKEYVLRRPPLGHVVPGVNDMAREYKVLSALAKHYHFAPHTVLYCADAAVIGAHFQIMEYRQGRVISGANLAPELDVPNVGQRLTASMLDLLVQLHALDPEKVGLGDLGRPEGFLARAVSGWSRRAELASDMRPNEASRFITRWLDRHKVPGLPATLLHCDFKLDNLILNPDSLEPRALLDWDMATLGDPLFDLATLLSYWTEAGDPPAMHELQQMPTAGHGFPTRSEVILAYANASGRDVSNLEFYRVLCMFKLGVVFLQLHGRYRSGATTDPRYRRFGKLAEGLLEYTHDLAQGHHT